MWCIRQGCVVFSCAVRPAVTSNMKTTVQSARRLLAASLIAALTACGGGGGSHPTPVIPGGGNNTTTSSALVSTLVPNANLAKATQAGPPTGIDGIVMHVI